MKLQNITLEQRSKLKEIGFESDDEEVSTSLVLKWLREVKKFDVFVEHGSKNSYDMSTSIGCHRGAYRDYETAESAGLDYALRHFERLRLKNI